MPVLTKYQDFVPISDRERVLNHAWLAQGEGTTDFYFLQVDPATGSLPVTVSAGSPRSKAWNALLDYSSSNVGTGAYVEVVASTAATATRLLVFDGGGNPMVIATGAAAAEVDLFYVSPGGWDPAVEISIAAGTRISIKALSGTSNSGFLVIAAMT